MSQIELPLISGCRIELREGVAVTEDGFLDKNCTVIVKPDVRVEKAGKLRGRLLVFGSSDVAMDEQNRTSTWSRF